MDYKLLENAPLFKDVPPEEINVMLQCLGTEERDYDKGETIFHAGDVIHNIGLVLTGRVQIENDDVIIAALQQGLSSDVLKELRGNLDANLGKIEEDGVDLSRGQWQRIAISRACLSNSAFVILDEPTASLDPIAETEMYQAFSSLLSQKGSLMISHRLASAKLADIIYVINDGTIKEKGTHKELIAQKGLYESMFNAQSSWYHSEHTNRRDKE